MLLLFEFWFRKDLDKSCEKRVDKIWGGGELLSQDRVDKQGQYSSLPRLRKSRETVACFVNSIWGKLLMGHIFIGEMLRVVHRLKAKAIWAVHCLAARQGGSRQAGVVCQSVASGKARAAKFL